MSAKRATRTTASKKKVSKKKTASTTTAKRKAKASAKTKTAKAKSGKPKTARSKPAATRKSAKASTRKAATPRKPKPKRHSPPLDLRHFRRLLMKKQANLMQAYLVAKGDSRARESDGTEDYIDYAVSSYDREFLLSLTELEQTQLELVNEALKRIDQGSFGLCTHCGDPIAVKRIEVQPWARYCLRCQELADSGLGDERGDFAEEEDDRFDDGEEMEIDVDDLPDEDRLIG